jgi:chromatin remodeling complex protein RSC6
MESKQVKQTKQAKQTKKVEEVAPVVEATETVQETTEATQEEVSVETYQQVAERVATRDAEVARLLKENAHDHKLMVRLHQREVKYARKNRRQSANGETRKHAPSGFNKPTLVPETLVKFLGLESGVEMPRTKVTSALYQYVKTNGLQSHMVDGKFDKRTIVPDAKLRTLFGLGKDETIEFKTFQTHVSKLYNAEKVSSGKEEVAAPTPTPTPATVETKVAKPAAKNTKAKTTA